MQNYPIRDVREIIHRLAGSKVFSSVDMKAGFLNVGVTHRARDLMGIVT